MVLEADDSQRSTKVYEEISLQISFAIYHQIEMSNE